jgi:hypothetical protein
MLDLKFDENPFDSNVFVPISEQAPHRSRKLLSQAVGRPEIQNKY